MCKIYFDGLFCEKDLFWVEDICMPDLLGMSISISTVIPGFHFTFSEDSCDSLYRYKCSFFHKR